GHALRAAEARRADPQIDHARVSDLPRGRQKAEDAKASSTFDLRPDAGRISFEMGAVAGLSDGGAEICPAAFGICQEDWSRARHRPAFCARRRAEIAFGLPLSRQRKKGRLAAPSLLRASKSRPLASRVIVATLRT